MIDAWFKSLSAHALGLWGPILEILFLAAIIYAVLLFVRGTRGARILRGLIILYAGGFLTVLAVAQAVGLETIRWLMENLLGIAILAVIVVFQPEIRRALIRIGESPVFGFFGGRKGGAIDEIVRTVTNLSKRSIGAIIVIERETRLGGYIESGVKMDAAVNSELLSSIFFPRAPLHDGAVIIRQGRIVAANCLLPFTENIEIARGMGARHRAGIGLSEEADAVVIVVSEETGRVSVAIKGDIQQDLDPAELRGILAEQCAAEAEGALIEEE